jgi:cell pole-organizing protein PopZ
LHTIENPGVYRRVDAGVDMAARDQVMSSTERAPEPTMEEILASIRRIISDDEQNSARQPAASAVSHEDDEVLEMVEGEADDKIINDIARVLSGAQQTPAEEQEEVLDLTSELGGLEIVEEEEEILLAEVIAEPELIEAPAPEVFQPAPAQVEAEAEAEQELKAEIQAEAELQAEAAEFAPAPAPAAPMSASDEAASALERAIAALRAGQLPTSIAEFGVQPQPQMEPAPAPEFTAYSPPEPEPVFTPEPEFSVQPEPEPEPDLILAEFEVQAIAEDPVFLEPEPISEPEALPAWEPETVSWSEAPEPLTEPEPIAPRSNGHSDHASDDGQKSLEDSVKDMLRPMLQRWLDENMTRVLTAALHDELRDNPARFQRD